MFQARPCRGAGLFYLVLMSTTERPTEIRAGDTYTYTVSSSDYPASAGWKLKVTLNNSSTFKQVDATTNADGESYDVTLKSADTDDFAAGVCQIVEAVESGSGASLIRHTIFSGTLTILPNIAGASAAFDSRTTARKMLDAIETITLADFAKGHVTLSIGDRSITFRTWDEMMRARSSLKREVAAEETAEAIKLGLEPNKPIRTRFGGIV